MRRSPGQGAFSELLARAEAGETITIRRHGRPVARLVPVSRPLTPEERKRAHEAWVAYRDERNIALGPDLTIKQLIDEGRP
ncbi:MAG: type II toxin-antitoxin system prevent-host-death family antitoxin [Alphaproteobacteria bacterium]|nr:type II toxin-antitoxin system prevent-host-death family antitoxin [Alphaproteobacteria bacterium]MBV9371045.1 type II toxin-antitoxin system prevent-host-death family antitoxin [Alphaproteobacteria bacterium]MBV9901581.1 type II toxin-antitoxin system prevent-host-death family antitoxin [Alphaproteobacteria bacterium]